MSSLHGSLFDIKCTTFNCDYKDNNNFVDPIVPALAIPQEQTEPTPSKTDNTGAAASNSLITAMRTAASKNTKDLDISDDRIELPLIAHNELPHCPRCRDGLLRPGVVWFGEPLPGKTMAAVDGFIWGMLLHCPTSGFFSSLPVHQMVFHIGKD